MKILAISRPITRPVADLAHLLSDEARAVWALYTEDVIREQYIRNDGGVVLMLECLDMAAARDVLMKLPLVAAGLMEFDIWALAPFTPWARIQSG
ncbi:MAG: hypothetical protein ACYDH6_22155 [Acidimicrobiales bacterium]